MRQDHLKKAHELWAEVVQPGDLCIDATCGNGHDTKYLLDLGAKVLACDIQQAAIDATRERCGDGPTYFHGCHSQVEFDHARLVVYNLGYLPGSDKSVMTRAETTIASLQHLHERCDYISIMCYPHEEGRREREAILSMGLPLTHYEWKENAPSLIFLSHFP